MPYQLDQAYPWGRTLDEYRDMFLLTEADLKLSILSCADGPSTFNQQARGQGAKVISCDPLYEYSAKAIAERVEVAADIIMAKVKTAYDDYDWSYRFKTMDNLRQHRLATMSEFLTDFSQNTSSNYYVAAALPELPFEYQQFDMALVANFLFLYDGVFDYTFHLESLKELCRVAQEVRIFPLSSSLGHRSLYVDELSNNLTKLGFTVELIKPNYTFIRAATETMIIRSST